jgi:ethanolamine ammonia-lyase small subunit
MAKSEVDKSEAYGLIVGNVIIAANEAVAEADKLGVKHSQTCLDILIGMMPATPNESLKKYLQWLESMGALEKIGFCLINTPVTKIGQQNDDDDFPGHC